MGGFSPVAVAQKILALLLLPLIAAINAVAALALLASSGAAEQALAEAVGRTLAGGLEFTRFDIDLLGGIEIHEPVVWDGGGTPLFSAGAARFRFRGRDLLAGRLWPREVSLLSPRLDLRAVKPSRDPLAGRKAADILAAVPPLTVRFAGGSFRAEGFPLAVADLSGTLRWSDGAAVIDNVTAAVAGGRVRGNAEFSWRDDLPSVSFAVAGTGIQCSEELEPFMDLIGALNDFRAFEPRGPADFSFRSDTFTAGDPVRGHLRLIPRGTTMVFRGYPDPRTGDLVDGFPLPVRDVIGAIDVRLPGEVALEDVSGAAGDGGRIVVSGSVLNRGGEIARDIRIAFYSVPVGEDLAAALREQDAGLAALLQDLRARGAASGEVAVRSFAGEGSSREEDRPHVAVLAVLEGVSIAAESFPVAVERISGRIEFQDGTATLVSLEGRRGVTTLRASGSVSPDEISVVVLAENVLADPDLLRALAQVFPGEAELVRSLGLSGHGLAVSCACEMRGEEDPDLHLRVLLDGCSVTPEPLGVTFDNLRGGVDIEVARAEVQSVICRQVTAGVAGGTVRAAALLEGGVLRELEVAGDGLALTPGLLSAAAALVPAAAPLLEGVAGTGSSGFHAQLTPAGLDLEFQPRFSAVAAPWLPAPLAPLMGTVLWRAADKTLTVGDLMIGAGRGILRLERSNAVFDDSGARIAVHGSGEGLDLATMGAEILGDDFQEIWARLDPTGRLGFRDIDLRVETGPDGGIGLVRGRADIDLSAVSLAHPLPFRDVFGQISLRFRQPVSPERIVAIEGESARLSFILEGREVSALASKFYIDGDMMKVTRLDGNLYGGHITAGEDAFHALFTSPAAFRGNVAVSGASLQRLLARTGYAFKDITGRLDYDVEFSGEMANVGSVRARGRAAVEDGRLWRLPVFSTLWGPIASFFALGETPVFNEGSADFQLENGVLTIANAVLTSPILTLNGQGLLTPDSANVLVQFSVGPRIPIIGAVIEPILSLVRKGLFTVRVAGPYEHMVVSYEPILGGAFSRPQVEEKARTPSRRDLEISGRF